MALNLGGTEPHKFHTCIHCWKFPILSGREGPYGKNNAACDVLFSESPIPDRLQGPYSPPLFSKPFEFGVIYTKDLQSIKTFPSDGGLIPDVCFQVHFTGKQARLYTFIKFF